MKQKRVERKQEKHDHYTKQKLCRKNFLTNCSDSNIHYFATKTRNEIYIVAITFVTGFFADFYIVCRFLFEVALVCNLFVCLVSFLRMEGASSVYQLES